MANIFAAGKCAIARERLAQTVNELRHASGREKFVSAMKAGFLGGIVTPLKMAGGNALSLSLRTLAVHPVEAAVDYVRAVAQSAGKGKLSLAPNEYRAVRLALDAEGLGQISRAFVKGMEPTKGALREAGTAFRGGQGAWDSVQKAVTTFTDELNTRLNAEHIYRIEDYQGNTHYSNPLSNAAVNGIFGIAEALDRPFWRAAHDFSLHVQSKTMAAAEGLTGDALKARAAELFDHATDEMAMRATDHANYATFKNKTVLGNIAQDAKTGLARRADAPIPEDVRGYARTKRQAAKFAHGTGSVVTEATLPFTGVPSSVAGQAFSLTTGPLSLVRLISEANRSPARAATVIAEAGVGTSLIAAGYQLAQAGKLTGGMPTSSSELAQFEVEGKQPYSVLIGDKWFDLRFAMPVAAPLMAGASLFWAKGKTPGERASAGAGEVSKMLTNQTYLQNLDNLIEAARAPAKRGERLVAGMVPIPAFVGQVARATDRAERQPGNLAEMLAVRVPGLSHLVPAKQDALGRPLERTGAERLSEVLSPSRIKQTTETPVTRAFRSSGVSLTKPSESVTIGGRKIVRTPAEQAVYAQVVGTAMAGYLDKLIASPQYQAWPQEIRAKALTRVRDAFHEKYGRADAAKKLQGAP